MDGVLADFAGAFRAVEDRLFGPSSRVGVESPELHEVRQEAPAGDSVRPADESPREVRRRRDAIWQSIESTPDFWTTLKPTGPGVVRRIQGLMVQHRWEVLFVTQRPATEGATVQRQTQRWLVEQGFDLPSVVVIGGSRGAAAAALGLDYHADDSLQNCLDVLADSQTRPILISPAWTEASAASARTLGIAVATDIRQCLDILEQAAVARSNPSLFSRFAEAMGWKRE